MEDSNEISVRQLVRALIRGLKFTVSLLEKVLKGEPV
jgi:hypothetical protein